MKPNVKGSLNVAGEIRIKYDPRDVLLVKSLPGAKWDALERFWTVSLAEADRQRLLDVADQIGLSVDPSLREVKITENAQNASLFGLYPFQVIGVNWLSKRDKALLADQMGLGKGVQTLVSLPTAGNVLIVCPASVKHHWKEEAAKWRPDYFVTVLKGKNNFRFPAKNEIVIVNYDILPNWLIPPKQENKYVQLALPPEILEEAKKCILVYDEIHRCKNIKASRSKKAYELSKICKVIWGLTGTPLENRPGDLFGVLFAMGLSYDVFRGWHNFLKLFNATKNMWGGIEWGMPGRLCP